MRWIALQIVWVGVVAASLCGCRCTPCRLRPQPQEVKLPMWFTQPQGSEQADTPVNIGIRLPEHLMPLAEEFNLPSWVVYGVVRSLGAQEFLANGTLKMFSVVDSGGESSVVVDDVYYDVPASAIRSDLQAIATACMDAESELDRHNALGVNVHRRFGGILLYSLNAAGAPRSNLLLTSGVSKDPMEAFDSEHPESMPVVGWRETSSHYITTMLGSYLYGNPVLAFRRVEEEAIRDLAKSLLVKFSHMRKSVVDTTTGIVDDEIKEEVYREEITLRMRGVRVIRRVVDVDRQLCLVEVSVPRSGVAMK
jgi:hypothetical protein